MLQLESVDIAVGKKRKLLKVSKAIRENEEALVQRKREWVDASRDGGKFFV